MRGWNAQFAYLNANCAFHRPTRMLFRHMDFDCSRAFVWTLEEGGVSSAARRLNRTQPAVTRMLQTLEDHLGAQLIDRKARPMRPTTAGLKVLEHARLPQRGGTAHRWSRSSGSRVTDAPCRCVAEPVLWHLRDGRFVNPQPPLSATDFFVRSGWSPRLYRRFVRGELDCAVVLMPTAWAPDAPYKGGVVRSENLDLIGPRGPHEPARRSMSCEELDSQPWILNPDGCGFRAALSRALASCGKRLHIRFEVDAAPQEHLAMVAAGMGYSIVPASALTQSERLAAQVQQLSVPAFDGSLNVWVIWSAQCKVVDGTVEAFAEISRQLRSEPEHTAYPSKKCDRWTMLSAWSHNDVHAPRDLAERPDSAPTDSRADVFHCCVANLRGRHWRQHRDLQRGETPCCSYCCLSPTGNCSSTALNIGPRARCVFNCPTPTSKQSANRRRRSKASRPGTTGGA